MINASNSHEVTKAIGDHFGKLLTLRSRIQNYFDLDVAEDNLMRLGHGIAQYPLVKIFTDLASCGGDW